MAKFAEASHVRLYLEGDNVVIVNKGHVESPVYEDFYKYDTVAEGLEIFVSHFLKDSDTVLFVVETDQQNLVELDGFTDLEHDWNIQAKDINKGVFAFEILDN